MDQLDLSLPIDVVQAEDLSPEEFNRKYHKAMRPVHIKGLMFQQPAGKKWTLQWFKENMGHHTVSFFDNYDKETIKTTSTFTPHKMKLGDYLDLIAKDEPTGIRLFRVDFYKLNPELRKDYSCPPIMKSIMSKHGFMFMGGKGGDVRAHIDVDYSGVLLSQAFGRKRVVLFGPENTPFMYKLPFNTHTMADFKNPDFKKYPGMKYLKGIELILEPGDAVYMPSGWWHYNTYLNAGLGVAYRKLAPTLTNKLKGLRMIALYIPLDKMLYRIFGDRWYRWKERTAIKRVEKAIAQKEKEAAAKTTLHSASR